MQRGKGYRAARPYTYSNWNWGGQPGALPNLYDLDITFSYLGLSVNFTGLRGLAVARTPDILSFKYHFSRGFAGHPINIDFLVQPVPTLPSWAVGLILQDHNGDTLEAVYPFLTVGTSPSQLEQFDFQLISLTPTGAFIPATPPSWRLSAVPYSLE